MIKEKVTVITNGQIIDDSKVGGTKINSMDSVFTSARIRRVPSSVYGKWVSVSNGSMIQKPN